eukprot:6212451-Pleurochrysis_carterae.AAC.2
MHQVALRIRHCHQLSTLVPRGQGAELLAPAGHSIGRCRPPPVRCAEVACRAKAGAQPSSLCKCRRDRSPLRPLVNRLAPSALRN